MRTLFLALTALTCLLGVAQAAEETFQAEMAGISGVRKFWNRPVMLAEGGATRRSDHGRHGKGLVADWSTEKPGAPVFDAIHRRLLIRFPGAAEKIAAQLAAGNKIKRAEIVFDFVDTEYYPTEYMMPAGMSFLGNLWVKKPPQWHAIAFPLRRPWKADPEKGPTWNANVNGVSYWTRFGAQEPVSDRFPFQFGPTEISHKNTVGRMDITNLFTDDTFGDSLDQRLRLVADQGFIVRKWETYDARYNHGGYEYGGAPGGRGIRVKTPRLVVTFEPGTQRVGTLPPAADISKVKPQGKPTAFMPSREEIEKWIETYRFKKPDDMPQWQWLRVKELADLEPGKSAGFPTSVAEYEKWVDRLLSLPYRQFRGHHTPLTTHTYILYSPAMPEALREHLRKYWAAWLMPGRPYHELQHNQWKIWTAAEKGYYARTGDWRGNHSFYRESYTRFMSTMNFNHLAASAALFGGSIIGDPYTLADGRYGLEHFLLRLWSWYDGTTQESIDHYYLGLTLLNQKAFVDLGPEPIDRMMGKSILTKTTDELAGCYHPALRHFISTSGRTGIANILVINEGPNHILHTVSRKGALHDVNNPNRMGMQVYGHDLPPHIVAQQQVLGPWMPLWMGNIVDEKPFPFEMTSTFKQWGAYNATPLWKRSYLGENYGLASIDVAVGNQTVPFMAQWRRTPKQVENVQELGTLLMRYGINKTEFYDSLWHGTKKKNPNGSVGTQGGHLVALQHKNKAVALCSPYEQLKYRGGRPIPENVHSLQSSIALANYQEKPIWRIYIDGKPVGAPPIKMKTNSRITIQDGLSFIGIIPIPATDLGRTEELLITDGGEPVEMQGGGEAAPTLVINNYNYYNQQKPMDKQKVDWTKVDRAYGGFVVEVSDAAEFPEFKAFQQHIAEAKLQTRWDDAAGVLHVTYSSGADTMELGYRPEYGGDWNTHLPTDQCFPYRRVNGRWPYLPDGLERDSTVSQQGRTGRLEKNQAVLSFQPGRMGYLLTEPQSGHYMFSNPLPDPQHMVMDIPGGIRVKADGKLGMTRLTAQPGQNRIDVEYALKPGQKGADMATALLVFGTEAMPTVTVNGEPAARLTQMQADGTKAWIIPLTDAVQAVEVAARYEAGKLDQLAALSAMSQVRAEMRYESGEHYLLTEPRSGAYAFTRLWPGPSAYEATVPGGVTVVTDGQLALQRLTISPRESRVEVDYAPYLQTDREGKPIPNRARALLIFGMEETPTAVLHGKEFKGQPAKVTIEDRQAWVVPLFGDKPTEVAQGIEDRYRAATAALDKTQQ